jgi:hypothetical protein
MKRFLNLGIEGQVNWPKVKTSVRFSGHDIVLLPVTKDTLASVHLDVARIGHKAGVTTINRFLSMLAWRDDQPIVTRGGWSGNPCPVPVSRSGSTFGISETSWFPSEIFAITDPKALLALALYREAMGLDSIPYSFLGFFKVLNVVWHDRANKGVRPVVEGMKVHLVHLEDSMAKARVREILKTHAVVAEYLYSSCRCAVAHAFSSPAVDPDQQEDVLRLAEDLPVIRDLARSVLHRHFKIPRR